jgi:hypothetical protein
MTKKKRAPAHVQRGYTTTSLSKKQTTSNDIPAQNPTISDEIPVQHEATAIKPEEENDSLNSSNKLAIITADQVARERDLAEKMSSTWIYVQEKTAILEQVNQLPKLQLSQNLEKKIAQLWLELGADYYYGNL